jgi:hypothetical protein
MSSDPMDGVRRKVALQVAALRAAPRLSAHDLHTRMNAIRQLASDHGLVALEGLARSSAQRALLPGHHVAMRSCLEHIDEALDSRSATDCTSILAAVAVRLH